tara:strand:+ start:379 stop:603 length:225 start_codon:yes stop_codon:yes gene_type:complete
MFTLILKRAFNNPDRSEWGFSGEWDISKELLREVKGSLTDAKKIAKEVELSMDEETFAGIDIFDSEGNLLESIA